MNQTIMQFFHWYYPKEANLWNHVKSEAENISKAGFSHVWLPPAYKSCHGADEPGYAVYDLYDLGEFDQKGSIRTRYGKKAEYLAAIRALHQYKINVLADVVLNHKHGADEREHITICKVNPENRRELVSQPEQVVACTKFTFPGRQGRYSNYIWDYHSFTGICEDGSIGMIMNEYTNGGWEELLEDELGNYDYLMGNDIEFRNPNVREELKRWGKWYIETTKVDGFRLDALKHISPDYFPEWIYFLEGHFRRQFFTIGEYWRSDVSPLLDYLDTTQGKIQLFDVPLHYNFYHASVQKAAYDLRKIFDNTLTQHKPQHSITFVDNHDTQYLQSLESSVEFWFKPIAYSLILLRGQGIPCVFYADFYGAKYEDKKNGETCFVEINSVPYLKMMLSLRSSHAYGIQRDYFERENLIGWTHEGNGDPNNGLAVLVSNSGGGELKMSLGGPNAGKRFKDACGNRPEIVTTDENGEGIFYVDGESVSIWIADETFATNVGSNLNINLIE